MKKNEPYPLNKVPQINNLKEFIIYCSSTYKDETAFQFEEDNKIVKITYQKFLEDINALGTAFHHFGLQDMKIALIGENSYQ